MIDDDDEQGEEKEKETKETKEETKKRLVSVRLEAKVQHVMGSADVGCKLDLRRLALTLRNTMYQPKRHPALKVRLRDPPSSILVYSSGKMNCVGCKSDADCHRALHSVAKQIKKIPTVVGAGFHSFRIHNRRASCNFGFRINLPALASSFEDKVVFEPDIAPSATFRKDNLTWVLFASGKSSIEQIHDLTALAPAIHAMHDLLLKFRLSSKS